MRTQQCTSIDWKLALVICFIIQLIPCQTFAPHIDNYARNVKQTANTFQSISKIAKARTNKFTFQYQATKKFSSADDEESESENAVKNLDDEPEVNFRDVQLSQNSSENLKNIFQPEKFLSQEAVTRKNEINECILKLEKTNPTVNMTTNQSLEGTWELAYTTQIQGGMLGIQILAWLSSQSRGIFNLKEVELSFAKNEVRGNWTEGQWLLQAKVGISLLSGEQDISVKTLLSSKSDISFEEKYIGIEAGSLQLPFPRLFPYKRIINLTYLDEDILIGRDSTGAVDVLIKKK